MTPPTREPEQWSLSGDTDGWMASHDGMGSSEYRAVKNAAGTVVALVVAQSEDHWADLDTETPGHLIAAAPELLEAAQALLTAWNALLPNNKLFKVGAADDLEDLEFREVNALRAAIAKATGQSPA